MRVLVLSHFFPIPGNPTRGIFVLEQMKALSNLGVEFSVIAPTPWLPPLIRNAPRWQQYAGLLCRRSCESFTVNHPRMLTFPGAALFYLSGLFCYLRCRSVVRRMLKERRIDLVHAHGVMPDGFAAVLLGREFNLPVACTMHGADINFYPQQNSLSRLATKWALGQLDRLIAVSSDLKSNAQKLLATDKRVDVIPNGADGASFRARPKTAARAGLAIPAEKKVILFVGVLVEVKGVKYLLQAMAGLHSKDACLYVVGDGDLRGELAEMAVRLGIQDRCMFTGNQPHTRIPEWLSAADCLVLPSLSEGLPTILVEAMSCGVPVIASKVGGTPEIIEDGRTGRLVPPRDVLALTRAIDEVLADPVEAKRMAEQAKRLATSTLNWECNARRTLAVYQDLTERAEAAVLAVDHRDESLAGAAVAEAPARKIE